MEMWHEREVFVNTQDRKLKWKYYIMDKLHKGIQGKTPYGILDDYSKQNL